MVKNNLDLNISKVEYAKLAHIINSKKMHLGRNVVYSNNKYYRVIWFGFDNWLIYDFGLIEGNNYEDEK